MTAVTLRVWIGSLSDYTNGRLVGEWLDVTTPDEMQERIDVILANSPTAKQTGCPAEEWFAADYESEGGRIGLGEHPDLETLCQLAEGFEEHGPAFMGWHDHDASNTDPSDFEDAFRGEWDSLADYVADWWEQTGDLPEAPKGSWWHPANYVDWDRMAHDLELSGDVFTIDAPGGKVWVFESR
jgi:antirestriction protein